MFLALFRVIRDFIPVCKAGAVYIIKNCPGVAALGPKKTQPNALHMQGSQMTSSNGPSNQRSSRGRRLNAPGNVAYLLGYVSKRKAGAACDGAIPSVEETDGEDGNQTGATSATHLAIILGQN